MIRRLTSDYINCPLTSYRLTSILRQSVYSKVTAKLPYLPSYAIHN